MLSELPQYDIEEKIRSLAEFFRGHGVRASGSSAVPHERLKSWTHRFTCLVLHLSCSKDRKWILGGWMLM